MTKYLSAYKAYIEEQLSSGNADYERLLNYHRDHIRFFAHERLIHLLVTILFALMTVACFIAIAITEKIILIPLACAILILLIPYIKHYYFLENTVQQLYRLYDRIFEKVYGYPRADRSE